MAKYTVSLSRKVEKQLDKLTDRVAEPILEAIQELGNNPRPLGCKKLKGRNGYRIRKGNYRIIYEILDVVLSVDIIAVGNRKDIYN